MIAPVVASGVCPACTARVAKRSCLSDMIPLSPAPARPGSGVNGTDRSKTRAERRDPLLCPGPSTAPAAGTAEHARVNRDNARKRERAELRHRKGERALELDAVPARHLRTGP